MLIMVTRSGCFAPAVSDWVKTQALCGLVEVFYTPLFSFVGLALCSEALPS